MQTKVMGCSERGNKPLGFVKCVKVGVGWVGWGEMGVLLWLWNLSFPTINLPHEITCEVVGC
jgi:hypothetical protein